MEPQPAVSEQLSLEAKVGQLLDVGIGLGHFETESGWPSDEMRDVVRELQPGGVRVYGGHAVTPHFLAQYTNELQRWAREAGHGIPLLVATDGEYGTVDVVRRGSQAYPTAMGRTATGDPALAGEIAGALARDMLSIGLNVTHQPVVDVNTNPDNPVIGVRSPGDDPETVGEYATALLEGVHEANQIAVAKHFPGHGDTKLDSHRELPRVTYDRETLEEVHLPPFERMIDEGVDCIMTSHIVVECLDPETPATLSPAVLTGLLREEMGFDGVVVTDAMTMNAIADNYEPGEAAVEAIAAGADLVLTGYAPFEDLRETRNALVVAVEDGRLAESRIDRSVERVLALKERYDLADRRTADPLNALETIGSETHEAVAARGYERSITLLGTADPLPIDDDATVLVTGVRGVHALEPHLDAAFGQVVSCSLAPDDNRLREQAKPITDVESADAELDLIRSLAEDVDRAVVTTYSRGTFPESQRRIVDALAAELPTVVVSLGLPNEFERLPEGIAYLATYVQDRLGMPDPLPDAACSAVVDALRSDRDARASLPVQ